ncbi:hypothetical protein [Bradyrhizobium cajani]|uniref:SPOR domain-containing protein n=1 Tax=Bradyrhizobium cajani TaxID=1928661 RepID=A0A844T9X5_9BRAD|nr:hypothetical protein [Bradyrhizobium cajani]MCP3370795.1 hypothetical protein [Bradyrhizobium cajani]MVT75898.1 hypothetical protein [Bradyrhizobium cajani]
MAKDSDPLADAFGTKETGGLFSGLLAEESAFDRRVLWRLGSWGVAAVGAVVIAVMANQAQLGWRRDQVASADLARQADRLQLLTKESQNEARRLAAAIETLNSDRDRLYSRVTVLEQGLDSVTGTIAKQSAAPPPAAAAKPQDATPAPAAPSVAPVASTPASAGDKPRNEAAKDASKEAAKEQAGPPPQSAAAASLVQQSPTTTSALPIIPLVPSKSIMAPPDPAASKLIQPEATEKPAEKAGEKKPEPLPAPTEVAAASAKPAEAAESEAPAIAVQQTRFAIDLGGANSIDGLRALWRGLIKTNPEVAALRPIIMIKEGTTGLGMQLRLGAGPLINAAAAAKLCAGLAENNRPCETTVFDGQRLSMRGGQDKAQEKTQEKTQEKNQDRVQEKNSEKSQESVPQAETAPASAPNAKPDKRRRSYSSKRSKREEPAPPPAPAPAAQPAPAKPETASTGSTLSSFFRR